MNRSLHRPSLPALFALACVACSDPAARSERAALAADERARRLAYCERDVDRGYPSFEADRWRAAGPADRGRMARDLLCSGTFAPRSLAAVVLRLGEPDEARAGRVVYRLEREPGLLDGKYVPPPPDGLRVVPGSFDLVFTELVETVVQVRIRPVLEPDGDRSRAADGTIRHAGTIASR